METATPASRQAEPPRQNQEIFDSTSQFTAEDHEPYYQDSDPVLDNEYDTWRTEEDLLTVDDGGSGFIADIDV